MKLKLLQSGVGYHQKNIHIINSTAFLGIFHISNNVYLNNSMLAWI